MGTISNAFSGIPCIYNCSQNHCHSRKKLRSRSYIAILYIFSTKNYSQNRRKMFDGFKTVYFTCTFFPNIHTQLFISEIYSLLNKHNMNCDIFLSGMMTNQRKSSSFTDKIVSLFITNFGGMCITKIHHQSLCMFPNSWSLEVYFKILININSKFIWQYLLTEKNRR